MNGAARGNAPQRLWAISSYFNPLGWTRRLANYRHFRRHLPLPLLTVELARDPARFQLGPGDADRLLQRTGEDRLWQKERLLNVALRALPAECDAVVWLDCDVVLDAPDWPRRVAEALTRHTLIQPFARFREAPPDAAAWDGGASAGWPGGEALGRRLAAGAPVDELFRRGVGHRLARGHAVGFAWAARRALLDRHGLYDGCILGSGDKAMAIAALGRFDLLDRLAMNARQTMHFRAWADPFFADVGGDIGCADATLVHLWHGDLKARRYRRRHEEFSRFGFDPFADIAVDPQGAWRWTTTNAEMRAYVADYFAARNEDGEPADAD
ncbi:hypothetical protein KF840_11325 [bacterium]|nr:hypothetical protein [bacterium]